MKRFKKWIRSLNAYSIICVLCMMIVMIMAIFKNDLIIQVCGIFLFPFFLYVLGNLIEHMQRNRSADFDIYCVKKIKKGKIVWHEPSVTKSSNKTYLVVENTGKVDIYELYFEIHKVDGGLFLYKIDNSIFPNKKYRVRIPCACSEISKIAITGDLVAASKTKVFSNEKSCDGKKTIFSKMKNSNNEKASVVNEHGIAEFKTLERKFI